MINTEAARLLRIKRANTDWWINEKAIVAANGLTYIAYMTDMGEIHIKEFDAKCSRTPSRDYCLCRLNCNYADEHNAPSLCILENGRILVAYTGHAATATLRYRITEKPYDISTFGPEITLNYEGSVTYAQLFENTEKGEIWLFTRVASKTWEFRYSSDEARTWSEPRTFLRSGVEGLFYFDTRRQIVKTPEGPSEQWFFALYGHPYSSSDHTIRSGIFSRDGVLLKTDGTPTDFSLYNNDGASMELDALDVVYASPAGTTVRLLDVSPTVPLRVAFAPFVVDENRNIPAGDYFYRSATFRDGAWQISEPICTVGEFLAKGIYDGSQTYLGGMAYYYGVGDAGCNPNSPAAVAAIDTNRIFVARFDGADRVVESYVSCDCGQTYRLEQVIRRIPGELGIKTWRPIVPIYAQDNLPVYWHEGTYAAHTGGWHCDEVMYVEYDD